MSYRPISPLDDRYREEVREVSRLFSEEELFRMRFMVEVEYLKFLMKLGVVKKTRIPRLSFSYRKIKQIEKEVGHDVKAVELYLRQELEKKGLDDASPFVHIGLTSEDVNSLSYSLMLLNVLREFVKIYSMLTLRLCKIAEDEARTVMLARTHGKPAIPTTFGKEIAFYADRLSERIQLLSSTRPAAKFSGAVGTYASFKLIKETNWIEKLENFVNSFGVDFYPLSKQVSPSERLSDILHYVININKISQSLCVDLWLYSSLGLIDFIRHGKVSSSTMPHKENPVDLEDAEGQLEISSSILSLCSYRLEQTRMQRDLSDSPIRRNIGLGIAHSFLAAKKIIAALDSMSVMRDEMKNEVLRHPEVLSEAEQIILRLSGMSEGYEYVRKKIKEGIAPTVRGISPLDYVGYAPELAESFSSKARERVSQLLKTHPKEGT